MLEHEMSNTLMRLGILTGKFDYTICLVSKYIHYYEKKALSHVILRTTTFNTTRSHLTSRTRIPRISRRRPSPGSYSCWHRASRNGTIHVRRGSDARFRTGAPPHGTGSSSRRCLPGWRLGSTAGAVATATCSEIASVTPLTSPTMKTAGSALCRIPH